MSCEFDKGVSDPAGARRPIPPSPISNSIPPRLQKALAKHGAEMLGDIPNYTKIEPIMQVNEVLAS